MIGVVLSAAPSVFITIVTLGLAFVDFTETFWASRAWAFENLTSFTLSSSLVEFQVMRQGCIRISSSPFRLRNIHYHLKLLVVMFLVALCVLDFVDDLLLRLLDLVPNLVLLLWFELLPELCYAQILFVQVVWQLLLLGVEELFHWVAQFVLKVLILYIYSFFEKMTQDAA